MRNVLIKKWDSVARKTEEEFATMGIFHQWATMYEELESGPGNYTVALVELYDGTVEEVSPKHIKFIEQPPRA